LPIDDRKSGAATGGEGVGDRRHRVGAGPHLRHRRGCASFAGSRRQALARACGIGGLSLHALAREVGIRQPSLYVYFDSKHALYDAMFADGNRQLLARLGALRLPTDPRKALKVFMRAFIESYLEEPPRSQLLFQRPIPGFT